MKTKVVVLLAALLIALVCVQPAMSGNVGGGGRKPTSPHWF